MGVFRTATARRDRPVLTTPARLARLRSSLLAKTRRARPSRALGAFVFAGMVVTAGGISLRAFAAEGDDSPAPPPVQSNLNTSNTLNNHLSSQAADESAASGSLPAQDQGGLHTTFTSNGRSVQATVNGHSITVPPNSSRHQEVTTPSGTAKIDISTSRSASGSSTSFSSTYTSVDSTGGSADTQSTVTEQSGP